MYYPFWEKSGFLMTWLIYSLYKCLLKLQLLVFARLDSFFFFSFWGPL